MAKGKPSYGMNKDPYKGQSPGIPNTARFANQNPTKFPIQNRANINIRKVHKTK